MLWDHLTPIWRGCIEEAWTAYQAGSLPIGAVITDHSGAILARGRNRFYETYATTETTETAPLLCGHRLAHAEMNALLALDWRTVDHHTCVLYTTTEPCPLCVGAIRMTRLQEVHFAARDGAAGSVDLFTANDFMRRGQVRVFGPDNPLLETALVAMLVEFGLHQNDENTATWVERLGATVPAALHLGTQLAHTGQLRAFAAAHTPASNVLNALAALAHAN